MKKILKRLFAVYYTPTILNRIKWKSDPPSLLPEIKDEAARRPKHTILPCSTFFLGEGVGDLDLPSVLAKLAILGKIIWKKQPHIPEIMRHPRLERWPFISLTTFIQCSTKSYLPGKLIYHFYQRKHLFLLALLLFALPLCS